MTEKWLKTTVKDIKSLKIQGASKVRKAVVNATKRFIREDKSKTLNEFEKKLKHTLKILVFARPTEPETRSVARILMKQSRLDLLLPDLKEHLLKECIEFEKNRETAMKTIAIYGANKIENGSVALTHCHSHTVEEILKKAWDKGKIEKVINTETRPKFQGRITAKNLAKHGIPITHIVDSAATSFMDEVDIFLTGADAILEDGSAVNKIGTAQISLAAKKFAVPHLIASSSFKFDPLTFFGFEETIEQRNPKEVWEKKIKNISIKNPAFDITPADYIHAIISERGVFAPGSFATTMYQELGVGKDFESVDSLLE